MSDELERRVRENESAVQSLEMRVSSIEKENEVVRKRRNTVLTAVLAAIALGMLDYVRNLGIFK